MQSKQTNSNIKSSISEEWQTLASIGSIAATPPQSNLKSLTGEYRKNLYRLRKTIGQFYKRVRPCGCYVKDKSAGHIDLVKGKDRDKNYFSGLQTCKSVWACPVCSFKIMERRKFEVREMLRNAIDENGMKGVFLTLTIPHTIQETNLKRLESLVSGAFSKITSSASYKGRFKKNGKFNPGLKQKHNIPYFVRVIEITKGKNGWHPHLHIMFLSGGSTLDCMQFAGAFTSRWMEMIYKLSGKYCGEIGQDATIAYDASGISEYMTKWDISDELTGAGKKKGKGQTPWDLIKEFQETGEECKLNDFLHYAKSMYRQNPITMSTGLKKKLMPVEEKTDGEIVEDNHTDYLITHIENRLWRQVYKNNLVVEALEITENKTLENSILDLYNFLSLRLENKVVCRDFAQGETILELK